MSRMVSVYAADRIGLDLGDMLCKLHCTTLQFIIQTFCLVLYCVYRSSHNSMNPGTGDFGFPLPLYNTCLKPKPEVLVSIDFLVCNMVGSQGLPQDTKIKKRYAVHVRGGREACLRTKISVTYCKFDVPSFN